MTANAVVEIDDYINEDGSVPLTADWDIGNGIKILADHIRARDGAGLKLYDDGGNGIFVKDGGYAGFGTTNPEHIIQVEASGYDARVMIDTPNTSSYPGLEFRHNRDDNYRGLIRSDYESGSPNLTFWTAGGGAATKKMTISHDGTVEIGGTMEIGGSVKIDDYLSLGSTPVFGDNRKIKIFDDGVSGNARITLIGTSGKAKPPAIEFAIDGSLSKRTLLMIGEEGSNDYGFGFWTTDNGSVGERVRITGNGDVGFKTTTPTAAVDINSDIFRLRTAKTPATAGAAGNQGDFCWDADYIYVCTATNTWKRTAIATW